MVAFPDLSREDENGAYTTSGVPKIVAPYLATTDEDLEKIKNMYDDAPPTPINDSISSTRSSITFISVTSIPDPADIISTTSIQPRKEHWWNVMIEVALPFFLGGVGTIAAGIILGSVEKWPVFQHVRALFILVPALQGLKGNLDMCLASRLSTLANKGQMHTMKQIRTIVIGNIALVQIQASVAAIIVAIFAMTVHYLIAGEEDARNALLLMASGIATATSSCFVLDFILIAVIIISHRYKMNPDNVATPMAASIGDVVCISLFSQIASQFYLDHDSKNGWILLSGIIVAYLLLLPIWIWIVLKNEYTRPVLKNGWIPVISALMISGMGGIVLDLVVNRFNGFVVFQPIINGIGGNLVSVQASRISTYLHVTKPKQMGFIPPQTRLFASPWRVLVKGLPSAKVARILILMGIVGQSMFVFTADFIHASKSTISAPFFFTYITVSFVQVSFLLYIGHILVHFMWKLKIDPDNAVIPYLTSIGDLAGSGILVMGFIFLTRIGYEYSG